MSHRLKSHFNAKYISNSVKKKKSKETFFVSAKASEPLSVCKILNITESYVIYGFSKTNSPISPLDRLYKVCDSKAFETKL